MVVEGKMVLKKGQGWMAIAELIGNALQSRHEKMGVGTRPTIVPKNVPKRGRKIVRPEDMAGIASHIKKKGLMRVR